jgi:hypothetical protein
MTVLKCSIAFRKVLAGRYSCIIKIIKNALYLKITARKIKECLITLKDAVERSRTVKERVGPSESQRDGQGTDLLTKL